MEEMIFEYLAREMEVRKQEDALDRAYTRMGEVAKKLDDWLKDNDQPSSGYLTLEGRFYKYQVGLSSGNSRSGYRIHLKEIDVLGSENGQATRDCD